MLLCGRLWRCHGASFPSFVGSVVLLGLLEFSDWQLVQALVEASHIVSSQAVIFNWFSYLVTCSFRSRGRLLIAHAIVSLVPLLHFHSSLIYSCVSRRLRSLPHRTPGWWSVERMRGLHKSDLLGDCLRPLTICRISRPTVVQIPPCHPARRRERNTKQKVHKSQTQIQHFHQLVRGVVLSDTFCFVDLLCEILDRVSIWNVSHHPRKSSGNWMHDSAGADVIFAAS